VNVLIIEDDDAIAEPLVRGLERQGFLTQRASTGIDGVHLFTANSSIDVVLLDLGLPDIDGYEVCRRLRSTSTTPIIILTARGDEIDRVLGLELGADDYVVKPFGFRELVARIRAVLRRAGGAERQAPADVLDIGALHLDRRSHTVTFAGAAVALTPKEYDLLLYLAADPGAVRSREQLMHDVWDEHWWGSTKTLDVHVASLRRKLRPELIETVRSVGYRLAPEAAQAP